MMIMPFAFAKVLAGFRTEQIHVCSRNRFSFYFYSPVRFYIIVIYWYCQLLSLAVQLLFFFIFSAIRFIVVFLSFTLPWSKLFFFNCLCSYPGGILHIHDLAMGSLDWLVKNATYRDHIYMCIGVDNLMYLAAFLKPPKNTSGIYIYMLVGARLVELKLLGAMCTDRLINKSGAVTAYDLICCD